MKFYEKMDHTADIGIRVKGDDLKILFENCAAAMFDIIAQPIGNQPKNETASISIHLKENNEEELLVRWLGELVSLSDRDSLIFTRFNILEISRTELEAEAWGSPKDDFNAEVEIKAVTYHELKIIKEKNGFLAQIIFDV